MSGRIFVDTLYRPIEGVEVSLPALNRTVMTEKDGRFSFDGVPVGTYDIQARKIGYAFYQDVVDVDDAKPATRVVLLPRLTNLDAVVVVGESNLPLSFVENRAAGLGRFLTRSGLEKEGMRPLAEILAAKVPGLGVSRGRNRNAWIMSTRYVPRLSSVGQIKIREGTDFYISEDWEKLNGATAGCYARVYLDNILLNPATPAEPVNINQFSPEDFEAIEYYSGAAQLPIRYHLLNLTRGVLILHTRRR